MGFWKKLLCCSLLTSLASGISLTAAAADMSTLDRNRPGSIHLTLNNAENLPVTGGTICLYDVAALSIADETPTFTETEAFCSFSADWDTIDADLAQDLAIYVETQQIQGTLAAIEVDGTVFFDQLELGIYLIVQAEESDTYEAITPFLVTVPMEEDGEWTYEIDAAPKVGIVTSSNTDTEDPTELEESSGTQPPSTSSTPETSSTPSTSGMPETSSTPGTSDMSSTPSDLSSPSSPSSPALPQTGQLNWPIPVLAVADILLFAFGWLMRRERTEV